MCARRVLVGGLVCFLLLWWCSWSVRGGAVGLWRVCACVACVGASARGGGLDSVKMGVLTGAGLCASNRVMTTAHATHEVDLSVLRAEWTGAFDLAREYLAVHPGARVMLARHRRSGLWAATDLDLNPAAARDRSWYLPITVSVVAGNLTIRRVTSTPWGDAFWYWSKLPGVTMRGWIFDRAATADHVAAMLDCGGYVTSCGEAHWIGCVGGVPA